MIPERVENTIPPIGGVEERHIEDQHAVVLPPVPAEQSAPPAPAASLWGFHFYFPSSLVAHDSAQPPGDIDDFARDPGRVW